MEATLWDGGDDAQKSEVDHKACDLLVVSASKAGLTQPVARPAIRVWLGNGDGWSLPVPADQSPEQLQANFLTPQLHISVH